MDPWFAWDMLVFLNFRHFSPERTQTWSLGATESKVWIGNLNVQAWKTTEHKLHKIWRSQKISKHSEKQTCPREAPNLKGHANILVDEIFMKKKKIRPKMEFL